MAQIPDRAKGRPIEIRFQNEAGSASSARWRDLGQAARAPHGRRYDWAYPFSAACPQRCDAAGPVMPANAEAMSVHLRTAARWRLAVTPPSSLDGAAAGALTIPENITLVRLHLLFMLLENVREYLRCNKLAITAFDGYDEHPR
jgi:hypothetical protein